MSKQTVHGMFAAGGYTPLCDTCKHDPRNDTNLIKAVEKLLVCVFCDNRLQVPSFEAKEETK
jgi:hypothetical protein